MVNKLVKWIVFSVLLALIPLIVNVIKVKVLDDPSGLVVIDENDLTLLQLVAYKGDLLLLAVGLSVAGIGDLLGTGLNDPVYGGFKYAIGGVCLANMIFGCLLYPFIEDVYTTFGFPEVGMITTISLISFSAAVVSSGFCVALANKKG